MVKRMCRSNSGAEIYDLAWSPDGTFFITGSMDNVARIFDAQSGMLGRALIYIYMIFINPRHHCTADCRAQPLRSGSRLGSTQ